jgi:hypothetical protein
MPIDPNDAPIGYMACPTKCADDATACTGCDFRSKNNLTCELGLRADAAGNPRAYFCTPAARVDRQPVIFKKREAPLTVDPALAPPGHIAVPEIGACDECQFNDKFFGGCALPKEKEVPCTAERRPDGCNVIFKKAPPVPAADDTWPQVLEQFAKDAQVQGLSDMDALVAWGLGVVAFKKAREMGALFHHD